MRTATASRVRTTTLAAPTRPTTHADALLRFDFNGHGIAASERTRRAIERERGASIKESIIHWLEQQL